MPDIRTVVTELVTGLGSLQYATVDDALAARPAEMASVSPEQWQQLDAARAGGALNDQFEASFANGQAFLHAQDGLRERLPALVEWKGGQKNPGDDSLPVDLRIDHVYLISCKYDSHLLHNGAPARVFDNALRRSRKVTSDNWFAELAPVEYQHLYEAARQYCDQALPAQAVELTQDHRQALKGSLTNSVWRDLAAEYRQLCEAVAHTTAQRWAAVLVSKQAQEEFFWRVLRMGPAPYFILGSAPLGPLRLRIATPWDWRQQYLFREFKVAPLYGGQPMVSWSALVRDRHTGAELETTGFVEIRWSHGRFSSIEAKVHLTTPHRDVPGYFVLA